MRSRSFESLHLTSSGDAPATLAGRLVALVRRWTSSRFRQVIQLLCAIGGHDLVLHFEPHRLSLRCTNCGYQSRGWEIGESRRQDLHPVQATSRMERTPSRPARQAA